MPTTNCGAETPTKEATISAWSAARPRLTRGDHAHGQADRQLAEDGAGHQQQASPAAATAISSETSVRCR